MAGDEAFRSSIVSEVFPPTAGEVASGAGSLITIWAWAPDYRISFDKTRHFAMMEHNEMGFVDKRRKGARQLGVPREGKESFVASSQTA